MPRPTIQFSSRLACSRALPIAVSTKIKTDKLYG